MTGPPPKANELSAGWGLVIFATICVIGIVLLLFVEGWQIVGFTCMACGGALALLFWRRFGKSPEALAVFESGRASSDLTNGSADSFPTIPKIRVSRRPDQSLSYRLPLGPWKRLGKAILILLFVAFWNAFVFLFLGLFLGFLKDEPNYLLALFMVPFAGLGVFLIVYMIYASVLSVLCLRALVDLESHPLFPGQEVRVQARQRGPLPLMRITTTIVCDELATFPHGDSYKSKTHRKREFEVELASDGWKCHGQFTVPADAMHSFKSSHNEIQWKVVIKGRVAGLLPVSWEYPFLVLPAVTQRSAR